MTKATTNRSADRIGNNARENASLISPAELARKPAHERNAALLEMASSGHFDFIDFGTHTGGGLRFGVEVLRGRYGLGVELSDRKAVANLENGLYVYSGDLLAIPLSSRYFRFAVCRHILEHLPNEQSVNAVLRKVATLCSDMIYVEQPDFSNEQYLRSLGLITTAATLKHHTCVLTEQELRAIVESVGIRRYIVGGMRPLRDSRSPWIHAAGSPPDRWKWTEADLPKPVMDFNRPIFRDIVLLLALRDDVDLTSLGASIKGLAIRESIG